MKVELGQKQEGKAGEEGVSGCAGGREAEDSGEPGASGSFLPAQQTRERIRCFRFQGCIMNGHRWRLETAPLICSHFCRTGVHSITGAPSQGLQAEQRYQASPLLTGILCSFFGVPSKIISDGGRNQALYHSLAVSPSGGVAPSAFKLPMETLLCVKFLIWVVQERFCLFPGFTWSDQAHENRLLS